MMGCTIALDGAPVVEKGGSARQEGWPKVLPPEKAALRKEPRPGARRRAATRAQARPRRHAHRVRASLVAAYRPIRSEIDPLPLAAAVAAPAPPSRCR